METTKKPLRPLTDPVVTAVWDAYMKMYADNDYAYEVLHTPESVVERKDIQARMKADMKALNVEGYVD